MWFYRILRLALAVAAGLAIQLIKLDPIEYLTYDWRLRFRSPPPKTGNIITVAIDKPSVKILGNYNEFGSELSPETHLNFLKKIMSKKPKAIVYTINRESNIPISKESEKSIEELALYTENKPIFFGKDLIFNPNDTSMSQFDKPFDHFKTLQAPVTRDRESFGRDTVTRRALITYDGFPTMPVIMAREFTNTSKYRGQFPFFKSQQLFINYRPQGTYKAISFIDVIDEKINLENFRNKIVIVGTADSALNIADYVTTPYSRELMSMSNLEVHANIIDTLILNNGLIKTPPWVRILLTCLVSILVVFVVLNVKPANGLIVILMTLFSLISLSVVLFAGFDIFLEITHPILAVFICYYFFIPYRLIVENRKSWEYYHKNKLLIQVEELKSNFMRMMSHDLKTPLARIQGMTELIRIENNLKPEQVQALNTIAESSEELTEFIGSILSLGRIEGKEVKLNLQSKDINNIIDKVINKFDFQTQSKKIQIIKEFEPLFSVQVDEDLIKQVFINLLENAIKYSPEKSKILITTEEKNGKVYIQVADQGIGIEKKDQSEIFSKFFRSPLVSNGPIKGSGLGLYLAKYFVELHSGKIFVESEPQQGSTFTVELPIEMPI